MLAFELEIQTTALFVIHRLQEPPFPRSPLPLELQKRAAWTPYRSSFPLTGGAAGVESGSEIKNALRLFPYGDLLHRTTPNKVPVLGLA